MTVSNPATLSSANNEFGGNGTLSALVRGGSYVPSNASATIATAVGSLNLSQFNGVTKPLPAVGASISPTSISKSTTLRGTPSVQTTGAFTATGSGGNGSYSYAWSVVSYSNCSNVGLGSPSAQSTTVSAAVLNLSDNGTEMTGSGQVNIKCVITSAGQSATATAVAYFSQSYASCVAYDSLMTDGRRAGDYEVDDTLLVTDPFNTLFNSQRSKVMDAWTTTVPGVRIITALGAVLDCSTTAPIPVQGGTYVEAVDLEGHYIPTARLDDINEPHSDFMWDKVVEVRPIGDLKVRGMYVLDRCFWASKDGVRYILHHNAKQILIP